MKRLFSLLLAVLLLSGCAPAPAEPTYQQITMQEAAERLETETGYILLDVRTLAEFREAHIPGAICVPNESIGAAAIPALPDKEQLIFVYCRSGNRSKQAAQKLAEQGYTRIVECGGIIDWTGDTATGDA